MRNLVFIMTLPFSLAAIAFGVYMFVTLGIAQRQYTAELQSIAIGKVQPQTLTAVRKYLNGNNGHIVYRSTTQPDITLEVPQPIFKTLHPGDSTVGYHFPDGYFIPAYAPAKMIRATRQKYTAKMQSIQKSEITPQTLTAVRKDAQANKSHVIFRSTTQPDIDLHVSNPPYNTISPGDTAIGYSFPDGYIVPSFRSKSGFELGRWIFLGFGLFLGIVSLLGSIRLWIIRGNPQYSQITLSSLIAAIKARNDGGNFT